ncbi:MAG: XRE family transcriptional regulator [Actinomycetota bacterium]|jgi:predicted transcriptional regulator|nr:XRE family transcriptional regulator [Actinomycetota bacterium]
MPLSIEEMLSKRPANRDAVEAHKRRMMEEVHAYRLRELRREMHLTQVQLARKLEVSQNRVSDIERGDLDRAQVDTLRRYVEAVGGELEISVKIGDERFVLQ